jgi:multiple sugar transport system permease protein
MSATSGSAARRRVGTSVKYLFLAVVIVSVLFPALVMAATSLKPAGEVYSSPPRWLPAHLQWSNYIEMFRQVPLGHAFLNSLLIACGATVVVLVCALPAGYALARFSFPGRRAVLFSTLAIIMFSPITIVIALFQLFSDYGLVDQWYAASLADAAFTLPFCLWIMTGYFQTIPRDLDEAARMDGASTGRIFFEILLPLTLPGIATVLIFAFVQAWNEFLIASSLLTNQSEYPLPVAMFDFVGQHGVQWQYVSGAVLLSSIPVLVLFLFVQRFLVRGLTVGAIK